MTPISIVLKETKLSRDSVVYIVKTSQFSRRYICKRSDHKDIIYKKIKDTTKEKQKE